MKHIQPLTGLRGLAALIVFVSHAANNSLLPRVFGQGFGQVGVMLFFLLSGFLMTHLYVHEDFSRSNVGRYGLARVGRVLPLYYLVVICSTVAARLLPPDSFFPYRFVQADDAARALLLLDSKFVLWTIPVEVQFYVVFVAFWYLHQRGRGVLWQLALLAITVLPGVAFHLLLAKVPRTVCSYAPAFFAGAFTALLHERFRRHATVRRVTDLLGLPALVLLFVNLPELRNRYGPAIGGVNEVWLDPITWAIVYAVFVSAVLNSRGLAALNHPVLAYLGKISFGFYLIHVPVMEFLVHDVPVAPPTQVLLAFLGTVVAAHLSFHYFERPVGKRIRESTRPKFAASGYE